MLEGEAGQGEEVVGHHKQEPEIHLPHQSAEVPGRIGVGRRKNIRLFDKQINENIPTKHLVYGCWPSYWPSEKR